MVRFGREGFTHFVNLHSVKSLSTTKAIITFHRMKLNLFSFCDFPCDNQGQPGGLYFIKGKYDSIDWPHDPLGGKTYIQMMIPTLVIAVTMWRRVFLGWRTQPNRLTLVSIFSSWSTSSLGWACFFFIKSGSQNKICFSSLPLRTSSGSCWSFTPLSTTSPSHPLLYLYTWTEHG